MENPTLLLDPGQLRKLVYIADHNQIESIRRRAILLIAYHQGHKTASAAALVGLSPGRVRYWRRQFKLRGLDIFPNIEEVIKQALNSGPALESNPDGKIISSSDRDSTKELEKDSAVLETTPSPSLTPKISGKPGVEQLSLPARMDQSGVLPTDPIAEAGRKVLLYHFAEMLSHEDGTRQGIDSEELHDMRVATRRMRAAFDIFSEAFDAKAIRPHLKGLKATGRALGQVRDMDVFIEKAISYQQGLSEEYRMGLDPLLRAWCQERELHRSQMLSHLDSSRYQIFKHSFNIFLQTPGEGNSQTANALTGHQLVRDFAPVLIYNRLGSVRAFEPLLVNASLEQLHALRIEFKKLRYAVEFFQEVLGKQAKDVINELKKIQDHLGDLNDARVATQMISQFLEAWESQQAQQRLAERQSPEPIVAFLAAKHAERYHLMVTFPDTWASFNRPEFRQNLALAIASL
jgi:CHAD domain-containing protein